MSDEVADEPRRLAASVVRFLSHAQGRDDPDRLAGAAAELACDVFGAVGAVVMLVVEDDGLAVTGHAGSPGDAAHVAALGALAGRAVATGAVARLADVTDGSPVVAAPLRRDGPVPLGAVVLTGVVPEPGCAEVASFAELVALSIQPERAATGPCARCGQLEHALTARVAIEQAKGIVAGALGVTVDDALERLRAYARPRHLRLVDVAGAVVAGAIGVDEVTPVLG